MLLALRKMKIDQKGIIKEILSSENGASLNIKEMGFIPGKEIQVRGRAPLQDPVAVKIDGNVLTLRNKEADCILVEVDQS